MSDPEDPVAQLVTLFARLPGVGERTGSRFVYALLGGPSALAAEMGRALAELHERVRRCAECGKYGTGARCSVCLDHRRDPGVLCVVARVPDLQAMERAGFRGRYHVLHALLAPLDGVVAADLPVDHLRARITHEDTREVILALPGTVEGEATALYVSGCLAGVARQSPEPLRITRLASGIQFGGELEMADPITIARALDGRRVA